MFVIKVLLIFIAALVAIIAVPTGAVNRRMDRISRTFSNGTLLVQTDVHRYRFYRPFFPTNNHRYRVHPQPFLIKRFQRPVKPELHSETIRKSTPGPNQLVHINQPSHVRRQSSIVGKAINGFFQGLVNGGAAVIGKSAADEADKLQHINKTQTSRINHGPREG